MGSPARIRVRFGDGDVHQLRIELEELVPVVWRRVVVSGRASLHELHEVIQRAFGREEATGYRFTVDGVEYRDPEDEPAPGREADAAALEDLALHPGARFLHQAEGLGDPWGHVITVEQVTPRLVGQRLPVCLAGGRAAPPDDCDDAPSYARLLQALADPLHPRAAELRDWLPEDFDPDYVDLVTINAALGRLPKHRPAA